MYLKFAAMIATSTVMMFIFMYLTSWSWDHVFWSETMAYQAVYMGAGMAIVMLGFMLRMYTNAKLNVVIIAASIVIFATAVFLARSQTTIGDVAYMRAMIPHHSIAILTSNRAHISDPRVRKLADEIISSQQREIEEMKGLIADLSAK